MNGAVANVLNSVLGTWVDNINSDQLKLSIFAGEVTLKDLKLKDSAIESLGFPFTLQYGRIASLKVDIPWSKLSSSPLVIEISEIYGLISPSPPSSWSESKEKEKMKVFKKALIENYEALSSSELSISEEKGFVEKLVKKIILNVQIRIKGVYLIFQDTITSCNPFSAGVFIGSLEAFTTNADWKAEFIESADINFKKASLSNFYVFFNDFIQEVEGNSEAERFENLVKMEKEGEIKHSYILEPSTFVMKAKLNLNPKGNSENLYDIKLENDRIALGIDCFQLKHVMKVLEYLDAFNLFTKGIERNLQEPDMPEDLVNIYREKYKIFRIITKKNQNKGKKEKEELDKIESEYNVYSILQNRKIVDKQLELFRRQESIKEEIKKTESEKSEGTLSKLSSFFWGKSDSAKKEDEEKRQEKIEKMNRQLQEILSEQSNLEREMNELVGKPEDFQKFPKDFTLYSISLSINKTLFSLKDNHAALSLFKMKNLIVSLNIRETSLNCKLNITSTKIRDCINPKAHSKYLMIGSSLASEYEDLDKSFFKFKSGGLELYCNFLTIFSISNSITAALSATSSKITAGFKDQISQTASKYIESGQEFMKEFLQGSNQASIQVFIDVKAPVFYVPLDPQSSCTSLVVLDVGHLYGKTDTDKENGFSFNVYDFELSKVRISAVLDCDDYRNWKNFHCFDVLPETSYFVNAKVCSQVQYEFPSIKVNVKVNCMEVRMRNDVLRFLFQLYAAVLDQMPKGIDAEVKESGGLDGGKVEDTESYKDLMKKFKQVIGIQFVVHLNKFIFKLSETTKDLLSLSLDSLVFSSNLISDSTLITELCLNQIDLIDLRSSILFPKLICNPCINSDNYSSEEQIPQIKLSLLLKPREDLLDVGVYLNDMRVMLESSIIAELLQNFSIPSSLIPNTTQSVDLKPACKYTTKFNSRMVLQLSNFEIWLPLTTEQPSKRTGYFSLGAFAEYRAVEEYIVMLNKDGVEVSREYKSIQNDASLELTNLGGFVGLVNHDRVVLSEERTFELLPSTRIGVEYKCIKLLDSKSNPSNPCEERDALEALGSEMTTFISLNLESIQIEVGFRDLQFFKKLSETWLKLLSPPAPAPATDPTLRLQQSMLSSSSHSSKSQSPSEESSFMPNNNKIFLNLDCDALRLTVLEDTGVKAYSLLYFHISSLKLILEQAGSTYQGSVSTFMYSDYYNLKQSSWEPLLEKWNFDIVAVQPSAEVPLAITASSTSMLNINLTMTMLETIGILSRKLGENSSFWEENSAKEQALTDTNEILAHGQFFYSIENSLGVPFSVWLHVPGGQVEDWKLPPGGSQLLSYHALQELISSSSRKQGLSNGITAELRAPISLCLHVEGFNTVENLFFEKNGIRGFCLEGAERKFDCVLNVFTRDDLKVVRIESAVTCVNNIFIPLVLSFGSSQVELEPGKMLPVPMKWLLASEKPTVLAKGGSVSLMENKYFELISGDWAVQVVRKAKTATRISQTFVLFDPPLQFENLLPGLLSIYLNRAEAPVAVLNSGSLHNCFRLSPEQVKEVMIKGEFLNEQQEKLLIESQWTMIGSGLTQISISGNLAGKSVAVDSFNLEIMKGKHYDLSERKKAEEVSDLKTGKKFEFFSPFILVNKTELPLDLLEGKKTIFCRPYSVNFLRKPKIKLRITKEIYGEPSELSKDLNLEAIGISGCVVLPFKKKTETTPTEYLLGVSVLAPSQPLIRSKIITLAPRFIITNKLSIPLFIRQSFSHHEGGITIQIQSGEYKTYNLENSEQSRTVQISRDGENWSSPFSLQNVEDFQVKFKGNKEDYDRNLWFSPNKLNNFCHYARVVVTSEDLATLRTFIMEPKDPEFRINNLTQDKFEVRQDKYERLVVPAMTRVDWVFDDLAMAKVLNLASNGKSFDVNIDKVKKAKKFSKYRLEVRVDGAVRELVIVYTRGSFESDVSYVEPKIRWKVYFDLCGVGLSVIDASPAELFYISAIEIRTKFKDRVAYDKKRMKVMRKYYLSVGNIQIDNMQAKGKLFPMVFGRSKIDETVPMVQVEVDKVSYQKVIGKGKYEKDSIDRFSWVELLIQEMKLNIDQVVIDTVLEFAAQASEVMNLNTPFKPLPPSLTEFKLINPYLSASENLSQPAEFESSSKSYFKLLKFSAIKIFVSFRKSQKQLKPNLDPRKGFGFIGIAAAVGGAFVNISDSPLYFKELLIQESFQTIYLILSQVTKNYTRQGILQFYKVLGSSDLIGNPVGLIDKLGTGVLEFINEPVKGVIKGPKAFAEGVTKGVRSLVGNIVAGSFGSISKITGSLYGLVREVGGDQNGAERLNDSDNAFDNIYQGIKGGVMELAEGVTGIFTKPWKGAKKGGAKGLLKGIGSGILGVVTSPLSAALRIGSGISTGVTNAATFLAKGKVTQMGRIRFPRHFSALEVLESYNWELAEAQGFLMGNEDLRKEVIVFYMRMDEEETLIMMLTMNYFLFFTNAELSKRFLLKKINSIEIHKPADQNFYLRISNEEGDVLVICCENYSPLLKLYAAVTSMINPTEPVKNVKKIVAPGRYGNSCCKPKKNKNVSKYSLSARNNN